MFSRRKGRCCITATRRSSNAPLNPPVVSSAASSNNSRVSPANCPRIPPRKQDYFYLVYPDKPQPHPPLLVVLHSAGGDAEMELPAYLKKPWFRELSGFYALALNCGRKNASQQDYWYGQNLIRDHREVYANRLTPVENRLLATIHWVLRQHPIDPERVYLYGA